MILSNAYFENGRLDIVILGPMGSNGELNSTTFAVGQAVRDLLNEDRAKELLRISRTSQYEVHIPEDWNEQEIIDGILSRLDTADLVVINFTPRSGNTPSPNVYYELGLLHALGMPIIAVAKTNTKIPFYATTVRANLVTNFENETVKDALRTPLHKFLDLEDSTDFTNNRISLFYDKLPVIDISAAVGLATGYYYNFVGRLLRDGSFISNYPEKIKQLIIVRPQNVLNTFDQDKERFKQILLQSGYRISTEKLDSFANDEKGPIWFDHIDGIVIDLPRTIYPLKISPRLLSIQERFDKNASSAAMEKQRALMLRQVSERLLDRVQNAIFYHVNKEREGYRKNLLHFARMEEVPKLLAEFNISPNA